MAEAALAYVEQDDRFEIIEGVKFMAPAANPNHATIINRLYSSFERYADEHPDLDIGVFTDNIEIRLDKSNVIRPDISIVCNLNMVQRYRALFDLPDLAVEVLSPSTAQRDRSVKKSLYERNGVREYWIVDPKNKSVEVYHLVDGNFELDGVYHGLTDAELEELDDEDRESIKHDITVSILPDLIIDIRRIFRWWGRTIDGRVN